MLQNLLITVKIYRILYSLCKDGKFGSTTMSRKYREMMNNTQKITYSTSALSVVFHFHDQNDVRGKVTIVT